MSSDQYKILSTRPLPSHIIEEAALQNVVIDQVEFITTESLIDNRTVSSIKKYLQQECTVILTSMNAVEAIATHLNGSVEWKIYCMGNTTKNLVHKYFGDVIQGTGHDATDLAKVIVANHEREVVFFCGDQRRDELPLLLKKNNINVSELVVYNTIALNKKVNNNYAGILFYSPSAVNSFFKNNKIDDDTVLFAIGNTTAISIKKFASNKIIISDKAGKDKLVQKAVSFFQDDRVREELDN